MASPAANGTAAEAAHGSVVWLSSAAAHSGTRRRRNSQSMSIHRRCDLCDGRSCWCVSERALTQPLQPVERPPRPRRSTVTAATVTLATTDDDDVLLDASLGSSPPSLIQWLLRAWLVLVSRCVV